jgi:hypothetical protein
MAPSPRAINLAASVLFLFARCSIGFFWLMNYRPGPPSLRSATACRAKPREFAWCRASLLRAKQMFRPRLAFIKWNGPTLCVRKCQVTEDIVELPPLVTAVGRRGQSRRSLQRWRRDELRIIRSKRCHPQPLPYQMQLSSAPVYKAVAARQKSALQAHFRSLCQHA